jgi:spore coat-associated protein N
VQAITRTRRLGVALRLVPLVLAVAISAVTLGQTGGPRVRLVPRAATGALALVDSRGGGAILTATDMRPGGSATGEVSILDAGDFAAAVSLSESQLTSPSGLAAWLNTTVQDLTSGRTVYSGPLTTMGSVDLGTFAPRAAHDFRFTVTLRADAPNSLQSATASVRYDWAATPAADSGSGAGTANPPPGGTGTGPSGRLDTHPPTVRLSGKWLQRLRPRPLIAYATCNEICTLKPTARVQGVPGVRTASVTISPARIGRGQRALIRVWLGNAAMAKARKAVHAAGARKRVRVTLIVVATDRAGNQTGATKTVVFSR